MSTPKLVPAAVAAALMAAGMGSANASSLDAGYQSGGMAILEGVEVTYLNDAAVADVRGEAIKKTVTATVKKVTTAAKSTVKTATAKIAKGQVIDAIKDAYMTKTIQTVFGVKIEVGPMIKLDNSTQPKFGTGNVVPGKIKPLPTTI